MTKINILHTFAEPFIIVFLLSVFDAFLSVKALKPVLVLTYQLTT